MHFQHLPGFRIYSHVFWRQINKEQDVHHRPGSASTAMLIYHILPMVRRIHHSDKMQIILCIVK